MISEMELFRLLGTIAIDNDEANRRLRETTGEGEKAHSRLSGAFSKLGGAAKVCGKAVAAGMVAAGVAIVKIGKDAVASYADYEQLVGGVETLFKNSAGKVQQYAQNAYKTAGLSANEYMETVTSFSASLLQSLDGDTAKAAESANLAITDMADNANKMGTSMESIQNAYQGFAKQNYTMLDNLKLGYGGTKEEMQRLLADAEKLSGVKYDISSFDDMVQAIHVVQTEMGITGTTAKEAATTIRGSVASMKGAWQNLLTGMADENQNLDALFQQFIDSVITVGDNLIPRIQVLLPRIVTGISQLASSIAAQLPAIMETVLPSLITGAVNIVAALIQQLPALTKSIVKSLISALQSYWSTIQKSGSDMLQKLLSGIENNLPKIISEAAEIIAKLVQGISRNLPKIIAVAGKIIASLIKGIVAALPSLLAKMPSIIASMASGLLSSMGAIVTVGVNIVKGLWQGIGSAKDWILGKIKGFGSSILNGLKSFFGIHSPSTVMEKQVGKNLVLGIGKGIEKNSKYAKKITKKFGEDLLSTLDKQLSNYKVYHDMNLKQETDYWKNARKLFKKGTQDRIDADQKYYESKKSLNQQLKQLEQDYLNKISEANQKIKDRASTILQQFDLFSDYEMGEMPTGESLMKSLETQVTALYEWEYQMQALKNKIGNSGLYQVIEEMGVSSMAQVKAINAMSEEELKKYVTLYNARSKQAKKQAESEMSDEVNKDKVAAFKEYKASVEELGGTVKKKYSEMNEKITKSLISSKESTGKYFQSMAKTVSANAKKIGTSINNTFDGIVRKISTSMEKSVKEVNSAMSVMKKVTGISGTNSTKKSSSKKTSSVKAHAAGGILTKPTVFGYTPSTSTYHLGGEAGAEAVAPIDTLMGYVRTAVAEQNEGLMSEIKSLLEKLMNAVQQGQGDTVIPVYIGNDKIDEIIMTAKQRITNRSGGFANV